MRIRIKLAALSAFCLLASCATPYQPDGLAGGYTDQRLDDNTAQVLFRGNRFNEPEKLHSYLLRRCAEITQQDGYNYFVLVGNGGANGIFESKDNYTYTASTTIKMFKNKPESNVNAYDAAAVKRSVPVEEGETAEAVAPPSVSTASRSAGVNPNAETNEPPPFEHF